MKQSSGSKAPAGARESAPRGQKTQRGVRRQPRRTPISPGNDAAQEQEQPFFEGPHNAIDPSLRHRMISEGAYRRYMERGYIDGYDLDDWLQAETEIDRLLATQRSTGKSQ